MLYNLLIEVSTSGKPSKLGKPRHNCHKCELSMYMYTICKPCKPSKPVTYPQEY